MAGPGHLFDPVFPVESEGYPLFREQRAPAAPRPFPLGRDTSGNHGPPEKGPASAAEPRYYADVLRWRSREGGSVTPPLPPPPRLRPRPPRRWAWGRAADPWQGRLRSP